MPKAKRARRPALRSKSVTNPKQRPAKKPGLRSVDTYLRRLAPPLQVLVSQLRALVASAAPEAIETFKWGQPVYEVNGPMAYLKAHASWVNFGFWRGAQLQAPEGILVGDGVKMRHVRLASTAQIQEDVLRPLIRQAVLLNNRLGDPTRR